MTLIQIAHKLPTIRIFSKKFQQYKMNCDYQEVFSVNRIKDAHSAHGYMCFRVETTTNHFLLQRQLLILDQTIDEQYNSHPNHKIQKTAYASSVNLLIYNPAGIFVGEDITMLVTSTFLSTPYDRYLRGCFDFHSAVNQSLTFKSQVDFETFKIANLLKNQDVESDKDMLEKEMIEEVAKIWS